MSGFTWEASVFTATTVGVEDCTQSFDREDLYITISEPIASMSEGGEFLKLQGDGRRDTPSQDVQC